MIARADVVAGHAHDVADTERRRPEQIRLQGERFRSRHTRCMRVRRLGPRAGAPRRSARCAHGRRCCPCSSRRRPSMQRSAGSATCAGSAESLVCSSAVTTNSPASSSRADGWTDLCPSWGPVSPDQDPGRCPVQPSGTCRSRPVTRFSHDDVPCSRQSTGGSTCRMWSRHRAGAASPPTRRPRRTSSRARPRSSRPAACRRTARSAGSSGSASGTTGPWNAGCTARTCGSPTPLPSSRVRRAGGPAEPVRRRRRLRRPPVDPGSLHVAPGSSGGSLADRLPTLAQGGGGTSFATSTNGIAAVTSTERSVLGLHVDGRPGPGEVDRDPGVPDVPLEPGDQTASVTLPTRSPSRTTGQNHESSAFSSSPDHSTPRACDRRPWP